ncbi:MAG: hypothetical protein OXG02_06735 [Chloroflexi bacterium]|nr:hypothetical protein [Chloroflexota bacterium]
MVCMDDELVCTGYDLNYAMWVEYTMSGDTPKYRMLHAIAHEIWKLILHEDSGGGIDEPPTLEKANYNDEFEYELFTIARKRIAPEIWNQIPGIENLMTA